MPDGMKLQGSTAEKSGNEKKMVCALSSLALKAAQVLSLAVNRFLMPRPLPALFFLIPQISLLELILRGLAAAFALLEPLSTRYTG